MAMIQEHIGSFYPGSGGEMAPLIYAIDLPEHPFDFSSAAVGLKAHVLATVPLCLLCKLLGKKLVFIESYAKVNTPTLTGKLLYPFADRFYVQWEELLEFYPKAIFTGGVY